MSNVGFLPFASSMFLADHDYCKCLMASEKYIWVSMFPFGYTSRHQTNQNKYQWSYFLD